MPGTEGDSVRRGHGGQGGAVVGAWIALPDTDRAQAAQGRYLAACKGCLYLGHQSKTCDFYLMTGIRRGCPAGEGCTRRKEKRRKGLKLDADLAKKLYRLNYGDE